MGVASKWMTSKDVDLFRWAERGTCFYTMGRIEIDADGAPNAYGQPNTGANLADPNPRDSAGAPMGPLQSMICPGSRRTPSWPLTAHDIDAPAAARLDQLRGWGAIS